MFSSVVEDAMPKLSTVSATGVSLVLVTTIALTASVRADQLISGFVDRRSAAMHAMSDTMPFIPPERFAR